MAGDDDALLQHVWASVGEQVTPGDLAAAGAGADQIGAAIREAARYDNPDLKSVREVYDRLGEVNHRYHLRRGANGQIREFYPAAAPGCNAFDEHDPAAWVGLMGVVAGHEHSIYLLHGGGYTPERWLEDVKAARYECEWFDAMCALNADSVLTFAVGGTVVAVPTCWACHEHLLAGGSRNAPTTKLG